MMKNNYIKNLSQAVVFILLLLAIAAGIHLWLIQGLRQVDVGYLGNWNRIVSGKINADVLITGSSRTLFHFDSKIIADVIGNDSVYNIGFEGARTDAQLAWLKTYLKHNKKPKLIVQGLDVIILGRRNDVFQQDKYISFLNEEIIYEFVKEFDRTIWRDKYIPLYGFARYGIDTTAQAVKGQLTKLGIIRPEEFLSNGFLSKDEDWNSDFLNFKNQNPNGITQKIDDKAVANLKEMLQLAKDNDVQVILVYSPEYIESQYMTLNRNELFDEFHALAEEFNIALMDYSDSYLSKDKKYFYNSQHLNKFGASIFSNEIGFEIKKYLNELD